MLPQKKRGQKNSKENGGEKGKKHSHKKQILNGIGILSSGWVDDGWTGVKTPVIKCMHTRDAQGMPLPFTNGHRLDFGCTFVSFLWSNTFACKC